MTNKDIRLKQLILAKSDGNISKLCRKMDMPRTTMENILTGVNKRGASIPTIKKICKFFKVDFRDYI